MKKILVILGSTREGRNGEHVALWVMDYLKNHPQTGFTFDYTDLKTEDLPMLDSAMPPSMGKYPEGKITEWAKKIGSYDGFIIVTPEYNHGYPAVLKNALDLIFAEWNYKPVAFVGYGAVSGGIRAVEQLRQVVNELRMMAIRESVSIPFVWEAFDETGKLKNPDHSEHALQATLDALVKYFN